MTRQRESCCTLRQRVVSVSGNSCLSCTPSRQNASSAFPTPRNTADLSSQVHFAVSRPFSHTLRAQVSVTITKTLLACTYSCVSCVLRRWFSPPGSPQSDHCNMSRQVGFSPFLSIISCPCTLVFPRYDHPQNLRQPNGSFMRFDDQKVV